MTHDEDLVALEAIPKIVDDLEGVLLHLGDGHGFAKHVEVSGGIGLASSTLIPLHDRKVFLPRSLKRTAQGNEGDARPAVNEEKNGIVDVLAAYFEPLVDPADVHALQVDDTVGGMNRAGFVYCVLEILPVEQR